MLKKITRRKITNGLIDSRRDMRIQIIPLYLPVKVRFEESSLEEPADAVTVDLSLEGTGIFMDSCLQPDVPVYLCWTWADGKRDEVKGRVRFSKKYNNKAYVGVQFIDLEPHLLGKIKGMIADYYSCENRIQQSAQYICKEDCQFYFFCAKSIKKKF